MITLNTLDRCQDCPEFEPEVHKEILYGDTSVAGVNTTITCANRRLCDRMLERLQSEKQ